MARMIGASCSSIALKSLKAGKIWGSLAQVANIFPMLMCNHWYHTLKGAK